MPPPQQYPQHPQPLIVSSQPQPQPQHQHQHQHQQQIYPQPSPHISTTHAHRQLPHHQPPPSASTTSTTLVQTPPSPPLSITSTQTTHTRKDSASPTTSVSPAPPHTPTHPQVQTPTLEEPREPFQPPVPWLSVDNEAFPPRAAPRKRRVPRSLLATEPVVYPLPEISHELGVAAESESHDVELAVEDTNPPMLNDQTTTQASTPVPSDVLSETASTQPTTPSSAAPPPATKSTPTQPKTRPVGPIIPAVPILPPSPTAGRKAHRDSVTSQVSKLSETAKSVTKEEQESSASIAGAAESSIPSDSTPKPASAPAPPKSWANLFRSNDSQSPSVAASTSSTAAESSKVGRNETLSDVLNDMNSSIAATPTRVSFLKPRGLVNTGNMCYMNSVLQVLVFSLPFYDFLSKVAQRAPHAFKSDTPLIDAIILFVQEYSVICSANTVDQLRLRLKSEDFETYGEPFIPEYVYAAIKDLPRFREMRRGHQQDAQEFLGFLLEELHEECARTMRSSVTSSSGGTTPAGSVSNFSEQVEGEGGWLEVGHKQKAAITRSSGAISTESPVTNIFGGKLRSELKVSGNKLSVTLEPYSPLQLDIGSPQVHNIIDALKGLTRPESMQGDFYTSRGQKATATKQVFIETLPPVLILHLKRFHYDSATKRAEKIWKKVGYPLELELPKEVFPLQTRNKFVAHGGLPKYRLTGVIYHHGKNANGGHYTVDIRRQDDREWIRIDDTLIRRVRSEDVAEGGSEEDPKVLAAALERHKETGNRFEQIDQDNDEEEGTSDKTWNQVNGHSRSKSTMSAIVNGTATPAKDSSGKQTPNPKFSVKDNKVAYLLFYQKISN
ncbi:hypothetical protein LTR84_010912 [Exophiala bonariae]|uniref:Ubiquitin carboxyl-terminal hydrolase n=1 Tax=Exophiala bonariae TaxID=1690606 RepID=A0AAV9NK81_9EURO|nr:hypothetical protein LTR84_010912 [Exophiala bonariae]